MLSIIQKKWMIYFLFIWLPSPFDGKKMPTLGE